MNDRTLAANLDKRVVTLWLDSLDTLHREALKPCRIALDSYNVKNNFGVLLNYRTFRVECFSESLRNALMIGYRYYAIKAHALGFDLCFSVNGEWSVAYNGGALLRKPQQDDGY